MSNIKKDNGKEFNRVIEIIETAKERTYKRINEEIITMYFKLGEFLSKEIEVRRYGDLFFSKTR